MRIGATLDREFHMLPVTGRSSDETDKYGNAAVTFAETVFGFWEDVQAPSENSANSGNSLDDDGEEEEEEYESLCSVEKNKAFWEEQDQLLQVKFQN